jgi:long-chain acyl-CoA synthetase
VKGPQVMRGYWNKPEETADAFVDGWFRTGDIVTIDEDGFVSIVDRIKDLVITSGFNVAPSEVEEALRTFPGVGEIAVVGIPNSRDGEHVVAAVVEKPGEHVDREALRAYAREKLTHYKAPRHVYVVDELPKSRIGKVIRREVREQLLQSDDDTAAPAG